MESVLKPVVYVQISGGVGFVCSWGEVEVVEIDWDSEEEEPDIERLRACAALLRSYPGFHLSVAQIEEFIEEHTDDE